MFSSIFDDYRDSQVTGDSESVHIKPLKQTVGAEFYDRSKFSRSVGLLGVGLTALVGILFIVGGFVIYASKSTSSSGIVVASLGKGIEREVLSLALNLVVSACTEATGFAHGIALRSALASEKRLRFNTNLRLLSAASGWSSPNNTLWNVVMTILLIVSYSSSLLLTLPVIGVTDSEDFAISTYIYASEIPLIVLGLALLLQAVIVLTCVWSSRTKILTWSSSPFDLTAALVHHTRITPVPGRCMRSICDDMSLCPVTPSPKQPSAWQAHPSIRKVIMTLWTLAVVSIVWGLIVAYLSDHDISHIFRSWSFLPQPQSHVLVYPIPFAHNGSAYIDWILYYAIMAATQGPLTLALHCAELVVNVIRDERMWRKATTKKGTTISSNPLVPVLGNPLSFSLLLAKPLLHWMFGLAVSLNGQTENGVLVVIVVDMFPSQILNYAAALLIVSLTFTTVVFLKPKGPQPAAYGHVQTLANLMDEFPSSDIMWWGDKGCEGAIRHAGTSEHRLPEVGMNLLYA